MTAPGSRRASREARAGDPAPDDVPGL